MTLVSTAKNIGFGLATQKKEQAFSTPSKSLQNSQRDNQYPVGKDIYDYCGSNGAKPLHSFRVDHDYGAKDSVNLYLARPA